MEREKEKKFSLRIYKESDKLIWEFGDLKTIDLRRNAKSSIGKY